MAIASIILRGSLKRNMHKILVFFITVLIVACEAQTGEAGVSNVFLNKAEAKKYVIASPIAGVLQNNGEPLPNIKLVRRLRWNGNEDGLLQEVVTDKNGAFQFPLHEEKLSIATLAQFVAKADIEAEIGADKVEIWYSTKFLEGLYDDTAGLHLNNLICDITKEEIELVNGASTLFTLCRW